ncbi:MAG: galactosamine-6-phosphate isomerase [Terriglobia bacterium]
MTSAKFSNELARMCEIDSHESLSQHAAEFIAEEIRLQPDLLLCAASGSTPTRTYQLLAARRKTAPHLFDRLHVVKLDEWGGLAMDHPSTCETYLQEHVIRPLGIPSDRYIAFRSDPENPQAECDRIGRLLSKRLPIDVCILGLGVNGHLGLNEPDQFLQPFAHVADLAASSLKHPMLEPANGQVTYGLTLGIADILRSRKVLLLVSGPHKRQQLERLRSPQISSQFPASFLWLHPDVTLLYDRDSR